jgi:predicted nucleic acid-binding protein
MKAAAIKLIQRLPVGTVVLPAQILAELFNVPVRKADRPRGDAQAATLTWADAFPSVETSREAVIAAGVATGHYLRIWEAIVLATSARAGCRLLLSERSQRRFQLDRGEPDKPSCDVPASTLAALINR